MRLKNLSFLKSGEILIAVVAFPFANCSINASRADDNSLDCGPSANDNLSPISFTFGVSAECPRNLFGPRSSGKRVNFIDAPLSGTGFQNIKKRRD
jgi:hypothetical protein